MKIATAFFIVSISVPVIMPCFVSAADLYPGDTSIFGVASALQPNVLIALDNSSSMAGAPLIPGGPYDPAVDYTHGNNCSTTSGGPANTECFKNKIYTYIATTTPDSGKSIVASGLQVDVSSIAPTCGTTTNNGSTCTTAGAYNKTTPLSSLTTYGVLNVSSSQCKLSTTGGCGTKGSATYVTGNYINWINTVGASSTKAQVAIRVIKNLINTSPGIKFGLMTFFRNSGTGGGQLISTNVSPASAGTNYVTAVKDMTTPFPTSASSTTNLDALLAALGDGTNTSSNYNTVSFNSGFGTQDGELLLEAGRYFQNCPAGVADGAASCGTPAFSSTVGVGADGKYISPIEASCQKNYVILITDGVSSENSTILGTICDKNSCAPDGCKSSGCSDFPTGNHSTGLSNSTSAIAKYLYNSTQNISTFTIGFGLTGGDADAIAMLNIAADQDHGRGKYFPAGSETELTKSLLQIVSTINETNSTFVAPVVPVSPQNRTYGASRVYMGFFTPQTGAPWQGNLKKYGLSSTSNILDGSTPPTYATWVDNKAPFGIDDNTAESIPSGAANGSFRTASQSYWSTTTDGGTVDSGGVGSKLHSLATPSPRTLYTMASTASTALTTFDTTNVTATMLDVPDNTARDKLVNYMHGADAYDSNTNSNITENRDWFMGDVLHSRPVVVNYATYTFSTANEANCTTNKSLIFVGSNDGMLHAFKDCDGSEAWAFIPPDLLPTLQNIPSGADHSYFVDSSVSTYVYNKANDGIINTANGDKVVLIFGEGRGGGNAGSPTSGNYYALNVSDPLSPTLMWTLSNATSGFSELAETWSEPKIVKMRIGSADKIAAVFGAGYDNPHEDRRYGAIQNFSGVETGAAGAETGSGNISSPSGTGTAPYYTNAKGRGIYVVDLATLSAGVPTLTSGISKIWSYTYGATATATTDPSVVYSFPTNLATIDANSTGYTTRIYAGDTGGNVWRFDLSSTSIASWTGTKIFSANPTSGTDIGRKIFYAPSIVSEPSYKVLFFGTGDREHPLNLAVTDRMYGLKDSGQTTTKYESNMLDVTADQIQATDTSNTTGSNIVASALSTLDSASNYGWYIKLNETVNNGEKVLASPTVFNKVAYFTTFKPGSAAETTSCSSDVGVATLYALNYKNGNAVINYDSTNDSNTTVNKIARNSSGQVLLASDRKQTLGAGIPSGVVIIVGADGSVKALTSTGGNIINVDPLKGGTVIPMYWRQK